MSVFNFEQVNYDSLADIKPILTNIVHTDLHWHKDIEIVFACQGDVRLNVRGEQWTLKQGDIHIINSEILHSVNSIGDDPAGIVFLLQIGERFMRGLHINIEAIKFGQIYERPQTLDEVRDYLLRIMLEINERKLAYEVAVHSYCCNIFAILTRYHRIPQDDKLNMDNEMNMSRLKRIFAYVREHYHENPTIADIAAIEHISKYYLSHFFTKSVGMNYSQYLNNIKIDMVRHDLSETSASITEIMLRHGFTNFKTFNRLFKAIVGFSPTEYRNSTMVSNKEKEKFPETDERIGSYIYLRNETEIPYELYRKREPDFVKPAAAIQEAVIKINTRSQAAPLGRYYKMMTAAARASDLLRADVREHFKLAQREIGFQYVRFHGLFNDEMYVIDPHGDGMRYNFAYIDSIFDFLLEIGLKPFVEFSFMPTAIASGQKTVFFYKGNVTPPKDYHLWRKLVSDFMRHIISRYSKEEVSKWYFEVWNEPNLPASWSGSFNDYFELYRVTSVEVKKANANCRVGGPSLNSFQYNNAKDYLIRFLNRCANEKLPLDFVSGHPYPAYYYEVNGEWREELCGPEQTKEDMLWLRNAVRASGYPDAEIHLDEWNTSSIDRSLVHDTAFMAGFVLHNVVNCAGLAHSLTYWALTDLFEENYPSIHEFHGGFGLLNKNGLKKPAYFAFLYLSRLSDAVIASGKNYIVTQNETATQILAWNYCHYNDRYASGDRSAVSFYSRYEAFDIKEPINFHFQIPANQNDYIIEKAMFDREHGSVFDSWLKNGAVEYLSPTQLALIKEQNLPARTIDIYQCRNGMIELQAPVEPFGFVFFEITTV